MEKLIYLVQHVGPCGSTMICAYNTKEEAEKAAEYANKTDELIRGLEDEYWYDVVAVAIFKNFDESKFKEEYKDVIGYDYRIREDE